jgi:hypothetical protein
MLFSNRERVGWLARSSSLGVRPPAFLRGEKLSLLNNLEPTEGRFVSNAMNNPG